MAYVAPFIGPQGLTVPSYQDIKQDLLEQFASAYGLTSYLDIDAADYQWISAVSLKIADNMSCAVLVYNGRSPATAVFADLDAVVRINGIARKQASYSTVTLTIGGTPGTVITNGVAGDADGTQWTLPQSVTIPGSGTINVTGTAANTGAVAGPAGTITVKVTLTSGWLTVTNAADASLGQPVESDAQLRGRQVASVALPSRTLVAGTVAAIAAVPGVTRYNVEENPTGATDANGVPAHSISAVVEGGTDTDVATAIYLNRTIGCGMYGTTTVPVTDPNNGGFTLDVNFFRPADVPIYVSLSVHGLNSGFTTITQAAIKQALVTYLSSLLIGEEVTISALYGAALAVMPDLTRPLFSIQALTAGTAPSPTGVTDIAIAFNQVATTVTANIVLTVV